MRRVLVAAVVGLTLVSCGHGTAEGDPDNKPTDTTKRADDIAREQALFDAQRRPDKVVEALNLKPGSRVADIGAGSGLLTVHLARAVAPNGKVVATDTNSVVFDLLKTRLTAAGLADIVESRTVNEDTPGLEPNLYDAILLAEVDHYFLDGAAWLKAASLALKPGGRIVISNRIHRSAKSMLAAQKAGLKLLSESTPVPTHFIAVFVVPGGS